MKHFRVLVADDQVVNSRVAVKVLERLGCRTDVAGDGAEAIRLFMRNRYDLVLMDCNMAPMNGIQACVRMRLHEAGRRHVPIVAWTTSTHKDIRKECATAGMDDFIPKTLGADDMRRILLRWLPSRADKSRATVEEHDILAVRAVCGSPRVAIDPLDSMLELFGSGLADVADLFAQDTPLRLAALRDASARGDLAQALTTLHVLRGSCASLGAVRMSELCRTLEQHCKQHGLQDTANGFDVLEQEHITVLKRLRGLLDIEPRPP